MVQRGRAALRGLVLLYVIIALAIAATAVSKTSTAARHAGPAPSYRGATTTSTGAQPPRASPSTTALIGANGTATPTATASPRPRKRKFVRWSATIMHARPVVDAATGMAARVELVQVRAGKSLKLLLRIHLHASFRSSPYDAGNFYALDRRGQTYGVTLSTAGHPSLRRGHLSRGRTVSAWLGFVIPAVVTGIHVIWNDANRLFPPATVARIQLHRETVLRTIR